MQMSSLFVLYNQLQSGLYFHFVRDCSELLRNALLKAFEQPNTPFSMLKFATTDLASSFTWVSLFVFSFRLFGVVLEGPQISFAEI